MTDRMSLDRKSNSGTSALTSPIIKAVCFTILSASDLTSATMLENNRFIYNSCSMELQFVPVNLLWSSFFVTFLANKIKLLSVSILAVSATLDNGAEGYYQIVADSDDLKNRFFFLVSVE